MVLAVVEVEMCRDVSTSLDMTRGRTLQHVEAEQGNHRKASPSLAQSRLNRSKDAVGFGQGNGVCLPPPVRGQTA